MSARRTDQLRLAEQIALPTVGPDVFTTRDQIELSGDERHEISAKLHSKARHAQICKLADAIEENAGRFAAEILQSLVEKGQLDGNTFCAESGFSARLDGFTTVVIFRGKVLAMMPADVSLNVRDEVLAELKRRKVAIKSN